MTTRPQAGLGPCSYRSQTYITEPKKLRAFLFLTNSETMTQTNGIRTSSRYSVLDGARKATGALRKVAAEQLSPSILQHLEAVTLTTTTDGTQIYFPCPFKETEALVALKSVEASVAAAIAAERFNQDESERKIEIDLERTAAFGFSTYIATIGGFGKQDARVKSKLKGSQYVDRPSTIYSG